MTFNDIITSINFKIENSNFERFTVNQILDELNNTYRDLANKTNIFERLDYMPLENSKQTYTLPTGIYRPTRSVYRGVNVPFASQESMDEELLSWETVTSPTNLEALVYNNMTTRLLLAYPVLTDIVIGDGITVTYLGTYSTLGSAVIQYVYIDITNGAKYLSSTQLESGTITELPDLTEVVTIYGVYLPPKVLEINLASSDIHIADTQVNALIYGTAGNLLFTSGRTEDASKAQNFMKLYGVDESEVSAIRKDDFTGKFRNTKRGQNYRTPFRR